MTDELEAIAAQAITDLIREADEAQCSDRQREVLFFIAQGGTVRGAARVFGITPSTARGHRNAALLRIAKHRHSRDGS